MDLVSLSQTSCPNILLGPQMYIPYALTFGFIGWQVERLAMQRRAIKRINHKREFDRLAVRRQEIRRNRDMLLQRMDMDRAA